MVSQLPSTDEHLRATVLQALAGNRQTGPLDLRVGVLNAVAHLAGEAPSETVWWLAEAVAAGVPGVRAVVNRIQAPGAPSPARTINLSPPDERSPNRNE